MQVSVDADDLVVFGARLTDQGKWVLETCRTD